MNKSLKRVNVEDVLFYDIETVSKSPSLVEGSKEAELWAWKKRDRESGVALDFEQANELYKKEAALNLGFNKIVTIGVGFVKDGKVRIKALIGSEEDILKEFCKYTNSFKMFCSFNGIMFDAPMIIGNANKYFDVAEVVADSFSTSQKKPWDLKMHIDLLDVVKGTHYSGMSFDEACHMYKVASPKEVINGSMVTEVYYKEGDSRIVEYVKKDVFSLINLFQAVRWEETFEEFIDSTEVPKDVPILERIYNDKELSKTTREELISLLQKKKKTKKDKEIIKDIVYNLLIKTDLMSSDSEKMREEKKRIVEQVLDSI